MRLPLYTLLFVKHSQLLYPSRGAEYCDQRVCLCLFAQEHNLQDHTPNFTDLKHVAVAQSSPGGAVIHYVVQVLWMMQHLHTMAGNK